MPPGTQPDKITSDQGWSQLTGVLRKKAPAKLFAASRARQGLTNLTRGRGQA